MTRCEIGNGDDIPAVMDLLEPQWSNENFSGKDGVVDAFITDLWGTLNDYSNGNTFTKTTNGRKHILFNYLMNYLGEKGLLKELFAKQMRKQEDGRYEFINGFIPKALLFNLSWDENEKENLKEQLASRNEENGFMSTIKTMVENNITLSKLTKNVQEQFTRCMSNIIKLGGEDAKQLMIEVISEVTECGFFDLPLKQVVDKEVNHFFISFSPMWYRNDGKEK